MSGLLDLKSHHINNLPNSSALQLEYWKPQVTVLMGLRAAYMT